MTAWWRAGVPTGWALIAVMVATPAAAQTWRTVTSARQLHGERELAILDERLLSEEPATLQAIGDRFGTTREAVRQAETRLMARLKERLMAEAAKGATA